jgi:hypothetical protein
MCPIDALEPHFSYMPWTDRRSLSFAFLRRNSFVLKCPFRYIEGLLRFHQWHKLCLRLPPYEGTKNI